MKTVLFLALGLTTIAAAGDLTLPKILQPNTVATPLSLTTFERKGPTVQIGILLDTSNSMDGLINQAKEQLWKVVNEVAKANKNNKDVTIEVGLFEYGKSSLPDYEGHLQMLSPLTDDLDLISDKLFKLKTQGGEEYTGKVILESVNRFAWSNHKEDLKLLIIAGNESFSQGTVPYKSAIEKAVANNIIVNTILCGSEGSEVSRGWSQAAKLGQGKFFTIDQDASRVVISTPFDGEIIQLGIEINNTYIYYGANRKTIKENKARQELNSQGISRSSYIEKNIFKSKKQASSVKTDLVNAYEADAEVLDKVKESDLPDVFKGKMKPQIQAIIVKQSQKRQGLQEKISVLEKKREVFIKQKQTADSNDFGSALVKSIRKQALNKGFAFK